ncbi:MAG: hypothetical protein RRY29_09895 [Desulfovibrionaceae bacterium]
MSTATLTDAGRSFCAQAVANEVLHVAWGSGDAAWDNEGASLPSLVKREALFHELGRRIPTTIGFVTPDAEGSIIIPIGTLPDGTVQSARYTQVSYATPYVYFRVNFDNADAANATIREMGLFGGTVLKEGLPPGQRYFSPAELADPGKLIAAEIVRPSFPRSPSVRESYEFILPF